MKMKLYTFLNYGGNCEEAFGFYEKNLGAQIVMMMHRGEEPNSERPSAGAAPSVLHARLAIGGTILIGSDVPSERFQPLRSAYLTLVVDTTKDAERIYELLKADGEVYMPMEETFYAFRFAMLRDRFGTSWMILHEKLRA